MCCRRQICSSVLAVHPLAFGRRPLYVFAYDFGLRTTRGAADDFAYYMSFLDVHSFDMLSRIELARVHAPSIQTNLPHLSCAPLELSTALWTFVVPLFHFDLPGWYGGGAEGKIVPWHGEGI